MENQEKPEKESGVPHRRPLAPRRAVCVECKRDATGEIMWPSNADEDELCQECWEAACSRSWWRMVEALDASGLLDCPPSDELARSGGANDQGHRSCDDKSNPIES